MKVDTNNKSQIEGCSTPLSVRYSWHRPWKLFESCEWFPLGYRQVCSKIWCNTAAQVFLSFYENWNPTAALCTSSHLSLLPATDAICGKNSRLHLNVPSTSPPMEISHTSLVYPGKIKVWYFLNTPRILQKLPFWCCNAHFNCFPYCLCFVVITSVRVWLKFYNYLILCLFELHFADNLFTQRSETEILA